MSSVSRAELELIAQDCSDIVRLVLNKDKDAGVVGLCIPPYIALVAEESFNYLKRTGFVTRDGPVSREVFDEFSNTVTKLRARTKLFDDTRGGLTELIETLALAGKMSSQYFLSGHKGFLASLRRRLQPDLGIYYYGEHLVCTTHTAIPTIGFTRQRLLELKELTKQDLDEASKRFSYSAGRYLGSLNAYLAAFGFRATPTMDTAAGYLTPFTNNDHFGHQVYGHVSDALDLTRAACRSL